MKKNKILAAALTACLLSAAAAEAEFGFIDVRPRIITPSGGGFNDRAVFSFAEPASKLRLSIFSVDGRTVETMDYGAAGTGVMHWDGRSSGVKVPPGVYIYQLEADGRTFTGTLIVAR